MIKRKVLALLLAFTLCSSLFANVLGLPVQTVNAAEGYPQYQYDFGGGMGSETNPFLIRSATHLRNLVKVKEDPVFFKLANDITLSSNWTPLRHTTQKVNYQLDGDNYTISGLSSSTIANKSNIAIFENIDVNQVIKNVNIKLGDFVIGNSDQFSGLALTNSGIIENVHVSKMDATNTINISGNIQFPSGLVAFNTPTGLIVNSSVDLNFNFSSNLNIYGGFGGISAWNQGTINNTHSLGNVKAVSLDSYSAEVGGLVAQNRGEINNSSSAVNLELDTNNGNFFGGLVGVNYTTINNSHSTGKMLIKNAKNIGGLVGLNYGEIYASYSSSDIVGINLNNVGGLVGLLTQHDKIPRIEYSYASGILELFEQGDFREDENKSIYGLSFGGLVGEMNAGSIDYSYALGNLVYDSYYGNRLLGGFVGSTNVIFANQSLTIRNSYAAGLVSSVVEKSAERNFVSGFIGRNSIDNHNKELYENNYSLFNFYLPYPTIDGRNLGAQELYSIEMETAEAYESWDFNNKWTMDANKKHRYPTLRPSSFKLTINEAERKTSMYPGESLSYTAALKYLDGETEVINDVTWEIRNNNNELMTEHVSVDANGTVTATATTQNTKYKLIATSVSRGVSASVEFTVLVPIVNTIAIEHNMPTFFDTTINANAIKAVKGETYQLGITVTGTGNPANTVTWTITNNTNNRISIDSNNVLTIANDTAAGKYTLRAESTINSTRAAAIQINVVDPYLEFGELSITNNNGSLVQGKTSTFDLPVTAQGNISTTNFSLKVSQSSDMAQPVEGVITLDDNKLIVSDEISGFYYLQFISNDNPNVKSTVFNKYVNGIRSVTISPNKATILPGESLIFSGNVEVATSGYTVPTTGLFTTDSSEYIKIKPHQFDQYKIVEVAPETPPGDYKIKFTTTFNANKYVEATITVPLPVRAVIIEPDEITLRQGGTATLSAEVEVSDETVSKEVTWSIAPSDEDYISVDSSGVVTVAANAPAGNYVVTAASKDYPLVKGESKITVTSVDEVKINEQDQLIKLGESTDFTASVEVSGEKDKSVNWSSDDTSAISITQTGDTSAIITILPAAEPKDYIVKATSNADPRQYDTTTVSVFKVNSIALNADKLSLKQRETAKLEATLDVTNGKNIVEKAIKWSSSNWDAVTVDTFGNISVAEDAPLGNYTITASSEYDPSKIVSAVIEVVGIEGVTITKIAEKERQLVVGNALQLQAAVSKNGNINEAISWNSNDASKVSVSATGLVQVEAGATPGAYTITASSVADTTKKDTITITVIRINKVNIASDVLNVHQGESKSLTATVEVNNGGQSPVVWSSDDDSEVVTWSSSDTTGKVTVVDGLVTVDADAAPSNYTVTATSIHDGSISAQITVNVTAVTGVSITPETVTLWEGISEQLAATVTVVGDVSKDVVWTSNDPTAIQVDATGHVTVVPGAEAGMYTVSATSTVDASQYGEAFIFVAVINGVVINKSELALQATESGQLHAAASIDGTVTNNVYWVSEDSAITVDATGHVTVSADAKPKDYIVKAVLDIDPSKFAEAIIKVYQVKDILLNMAKIIIHQGNTTTITATVDVENGNANTQDVVWSSSDELAVKVVDGVVTVLANAAPGDYTITATSAHNAAIKATATITVTAVLNVRVTPDKAIMNAGDEQQLAVKVEVAGDVNQSVVWTSSNAAMVKVSEEGIVTVLPGASPGQYTITATSVVDSTKKALVVITVPSPYIPTPEPVPTPVPVPDVEKETGENQGGGLTPNPETTTMENILNGGKINIEQTKQNIIAIVQQLLGDNSETSDTADSPASIKLDFIDMLGHWSETAVKQAVMIGFVNGYGDGSFKPNKAITRAEFTTIIFKVFGIQAVDSTNTFKDVDNHWAKLAIEALSSSDIVTGYSNGTFAPDKEITREEMVVILSRIVNLQAVAKDSTKGNFADLAQANSYATQAIKATAQAGIITGKGVNMFDPKGQATRAEALTIIMNVLKLDTQIAEMLEKLK